MADQLPTDPRTVKTRAMSVNDRFLVEEPGRLFVGIKYHLRNLEIKPDMKKIVVNFTTDGLPLYNSGRGQRIWPFLMKIDGYEAVHVVSVYCGDCDPTADILVDTLLLDELQELFEHGWGKLKFEIGYITCDLQAMAKLKGIKAPTGYHSCYKCKIRGTWSTQFKKVMFCPVVARSTPLRTNESFRNLRVDRNHHQPVSVAKSAVAEAPSEHDPHDDEEPIIITPLLR